MKKILIYFLLAGVLTGFNSCQDYFLQQPDVTGVANLNLVYSSSVNALQVISQNYSNSLDESIANFMSGSLQYSSNGNLGCFSDELGRGYNFQQMYQLPILGMDANGHSTGNYGQTFSFIRNAWLVYENIDKVPDMSATDKATIKAEMIGLNAYRYMGGFYRYGGLPLVTRSYDANENLSIPRSSLDSTLQYTLKLCDQAIAGLPDAWPANMSGRLTKGAVLAMKARALQFAARPLFNSATPYLDNGKNNNLICFGNASTTRWDNAIAATQATLSWCKANGYDIINTGGAAAGVPNPKAFDDYGNATSTPSNKEVILAFKTDNNTMATNNIGWAYNYSSYQTVSRYDCQMIGTLYSMFRNYQHADGTEPSWPQVGDAAPRPASDFLTRMAALEPRFQADQIFAGKDPLTCNNPTDSKWTILGWSYGLANYGTPFPGASTNTYGCCYSTKFYYKAGSRVWFEFPIFRVAELYMNLAEAYNEKGDAANALLNLNIVHNRAGLPAVTETNQAKLRTIIQREWAVEFFLEAQRLYTVRHWKMPNISNEILGGDVKEFQFTVKSTAGNVNLAANLVTYWLAPTYTKFWSPRMYMEPIPQSEINKKVAVQNPGY